MFHDPLPTSSSQNVEIVSHFRTGIGAAGQVTSNSTYLNASTSALAQPEAAHGAQDEDNIWNTDPPLPQVQEEDYPFMDPAYDYHLDFTESGPSKRRRTISVRIACAIYGFRAYPLNRTIPCESGLKNATSSWPN